MRSSHRITALPFLSMLIAAAGWSAAGCADAGDPRPPEESVAQGGMSFDEFLSKAYQEPATGIYIVDGDTPIESYEKLVAFYEKHFQKGALTVYQPEPGVDAKWDDTQKMSLTYCVSQSFGASYAAVVQAMADATAAWERAATLHFVHDAAKDGACDASTNVVFDVNPTVSGYYLARAFFPDFARPDRNILVDLASFGDIAPYTLTGILRHELGHALGFRHEHTRPEAGVCLEDLDWRALTSYDPRSVMHYPQCNGSNEGDLALTRKDREGAAVLYGSCASIRRLSGSEVSDAVLASNHPAQNLGGDTTASVGQVGNGARQALVRFDLSAIPAGAPLLSATVTLQAKATVPGTVRAHRVTAPWDEQTVTFQSFGGAYDAQASASFQAPPAAGPVSFDATALTQAWLDQGNFGMLLEQDGPGAAAFRTSELAQRAGRPDLDVCYGPMPPRTCGHSLCAAGAAMDPLCDPCVETICAVHPACCLGAWDASCIAQVETVCSSGACAMCGDGVVNIGESCDPPDSITCDAACHVIYPPEIACNDLVDDDSDGLYDCQDPTSCQSTPSCAPGPTPAGGPCTAASDCQATGSDPFCIDESRFLWPGGACSEFCDVFAGGCTGDALCLDIALGNGSGLCFDACATDADCRPGYACTDVGGNTGICAPATEVCGDGADNDSDGLADCQDPECTYDAACAVCGDGQVTGAEQCDPPDGVTCDASCNVIYGPEITCDDFLDNDNDGLVDCQDPSDCQSQALCTPGATPTGDACGVASDCQASGDDPACLDETQIGWPGGYCSEFCDVNVNDCAPGSLCYPTSISYTAGMCFRGCQVDADCRAGYTCIDYGLGAICAL